MTDGMRPIQPPANDNGGKAPEPAETARERPCPICGKPASAESRPFCSKRCADVDLHRWLGGNYTIAAAESDEAEQSEDPFAP